MKVRNVIYFVIALVVFSNGLSYIDWFSLPVRNVVYVLFAVGLIAFVKECRVVKKNDDNFWLVVYLSLMPLVSAAVAVLLYGQSFGEERKIIYFGLAFFSYYVFYLFKFNENEIIFALIVFGLATLAIQLYQQLDSATILFGYSEDNLQNGYFVKRNGIRRFYVGVSSAVLVCLYFFWSKILEKITVTKFLFFVVFGISLYLYLTRQLLIATAVSLVLSFFLVHRKASQKKAFFYVLLLLCVGLVIYDVAFSELVLYSKQQTYSVDARSMAIPFFFSKWFDNMISLVLGHGRLAIEAQWGMLGLNASDIGFIGEAFTYGVVWIAVYFKTIFKYLIVYRRVVPSYVSFFMLGTFVNSVFIFPYKNSATALVWAAMLYICNVYMKANAKQSSSLLSRGSYDPK